MKDLFEAIGFLKRSGRAEMKRLVGSGRGVIDANLRFEVVFRRAPARRTARRGAVPSMRARRLA